MSTTKPVLLATVATLVLVVGACNDDDSSNTTAASDTTGAAGGTAATPQGTGEVCFDRGESFQGDVRLYIEHNATDEDTGVHGMFDQEGLAAACLEKPDGTQIMLVDPTNRLGDLGINQFFFESREPPNNEYSIADLKADFPEGDYRISGVDFEGTKRVATAVFTHDIPAPPKIAAPKVVDEEKADQHKLPASGFTVRWQPVSETLDRKPVNVVGYEVIITDDKHKDPNALSQPEYDVHLPPDVTELPVPDGFLERGKLYELEVLALEESGNQTISLGFFTAD